MNNACFLINIWKYRLVELESKYNKQLVALAEELEISPEDPFSIVNATIKNDKQSSNFFKTYSKVFLSNFESFMKKLLQKEKIITKESIRNYAKRSDFEADWFMYNEHAATVKLQQMGIYEASSESDIIISKLLGRISATVDLQIEKMIQSFRNNLSSINISDVCK